MEASEVWRKLDILDGYEAAALAQPTDKKGAAQVKRALRDIESFINVKLYGTSTGSEKALDFWALMKTPEGRKKLQDV